MLLFITLFSLLLGFLLFGVASLRTGAVPLRVASLLLVPSIMWTALFVMHVTSVDGTLIGVIVYPPIVGAVFTDCRHPPPPPRFGLLTALRAVSRPGFRHRQPIGVSAGPCDVYVSLGSPRREPGFVLPLEVD